MAPSEIQIGDVRIHLLTAGRHRADAGPLYGVVPKALWSRYEASDEQNRVPMLLRCLLVETNGLCILVDTGYGDKLSPKQRENLGFDDTPDLTAHLNAIGMGVEDVDIVVNTHLHGDHCAGNTTIRDGTVVATFPRARYVMNKREYDVACKPNERTRATYLLENYRPLADSGLVDFFQGAFDVTPSLRIEPAPGHTADHCIVRIHSGNECALFLADLAQRVVQIERLAWIAAYDVEPLVSLETKRQILSEAAASGNLLMLQHDPAVGTLVAMPEGGFRFTALE